MKMFTSLSPHNIDLQKTTIQSWVDNGCIPFAVNACSEIEILRCHYPNINFIGVESGPKVFINDILDNLPDEPVAICNADIYLRNRLDKFCIDRGNAMIAHRSDVQSLCDKSGDKYGGGFDLFMFWGGHRRLFTKQCFRIGEPAWDYWIPLVLLNNDVSLHLIKEHIIFHKIHDKTWNDTYGIRCQELLGLFPANDERELLHNILSRCKPI